MWLIATQEICWIWIALALVISLLAGKIALVMKDSNEV